MVRFTDASEWNIAPERVPHCCDQPMKYDPQTARWLCEDCVSVLTADVVAAFDRLDKP